MPDGSRQRTVVQMLDQDELIHPQAAVAPGYLANHAARVFNRLVDAELRPHGVSLALIGPIMLLSWKGPMLQRDLVIASAVKQPAMVTLLDKLEGLKLIKRTRPRRIAAPRWWRSAPAGARLPNLAAEHCWA